MIGSRVTVDVTVDVPGERKQLGCSVKCPGSAAGFSFPSLPLPLPVIFLLPQPCVLHDSCLPELENRKDCYAGYGTGCTINLSVSQYLLKILSANFLCLLLYT